MYISTVFLLKILGRQNVMWTTTCYLVDEKSSSPIENREEDHRKQATSTTIPLDKPVYLAGSVGCGRDLI